MTFFFPVFNFDLLIQFVIIRCTWFKSLPSDYFFFLLFWNKSFFRRSFEVSTFLSSAVRLFVLITLDYTFHLSCLGLLLLTFMVPGHYTLTSLNFVFFDHWSFHILAQHWLWVLSSNSAKEHMHKSKHELECEKLGQSPRPGSLVLTRKVTTTKTNENQGLCLNANTAIQILFHSTWNSFSMGNTKTLVQIYVPLL